MRKLVPEYLEQLVPYPPGKPIEETQREIGIRDVVKLASNENPFGPSPKAVAAITAALPRLNLYPDSSGFYLKQRLSSFLGVPTERIILGNGTNDIIELVVRTFVGPGESVLTGNPSFIIYRLVTQAAGRAIVEVPLVAHRFDLPAMARAVDDHTKAIFIANPNNPTGTYVTRDEVRRFLADVPDDVLVVLDEAYAEYAVAADYAQGLRDFSDRRRMVVLRTFSKAYGLAGIRIGYGVADPEVVHYMDRVRQPFNTSSLGQAAALAAIDDVEHLEASRSKNRAGMEYLQPHLRALGIGVVPSQANFLLLELQRNGGEVYQALLQRGFIVRPMAGYGLPQTIRVTVGRPEDNERLVQLLTEIL